MDVKGGYVKMRFWSLVPGKVYIRINDSAKETCHLPTDTLKGHLRNIMPLSTSALPSFCGV